MWSWHSLSKVLEREIQWEVIVEVVHRGPSPSEVIHQQVIGRKDHSRRSVGGNCPRPFIEEVIVVHLRSPLTIPHNQGKEHKARRRRSSD